MPNSIDTVPAHLRPECGDDCCPGVDSGVANMRHSKPCDIGFADGCRVFMDDRYQQHLRGTPDDPEDGWACNPCRTLKGWPLQSDDAARWMPEPVAS